MGAAEFWTRVYSLFSRLGRGTKVLPSGALVGKPHKCVCVRARGHACVTISTPAPLSQGHTRISSVKLPVQELPEMLLTPHMGKGVGEG